MRGSKTYNECSFDKTDVKGTKNSRSAHKISIHSFIKIFFGFENLTRIWNGLAMREIETGRLLGLECLGI